MFLSFLSPQVIVTLAIGFFVVIFLMKGLVVVKQSEKMVIERLGEFHCVLEPGLNFIIPIMDKPRAINIRRYIGGRFRDGMQSVMMEERRIDVREQVLDFPGQPVVTADNVSVTVNGALYYQIIDSVKAVYEVENLVQAVEVLTKTSLRSEVGKMELDTLFRERQAVNAKLAEVMDEAGDKWGVKVTRVEIQDISIPKTVETAMHQQMSAERQRRATVTEANGQREAEIAMAEGAKKAEILRAEGEKQSSILRAQGQQEAITLVLDAAKGTNLQASEVVSYLLGLEYISTLPNIAKNGERVFLPYEATGVLSAVEAIKNIKPIGAA